MGLSPSPQVPSKACQVCPGLGTWTGTANSHKCYLFCSRYGKIVPWRGASPAQWHCGCTLEPSDMPVRVRHTSYHSKQIQLPRRRLGNCLSLAPGTELLKPMGFPKECVSFSIMSPF